MNYELLRELRDAGFPIKVIPLYQKVGDKEPIDAEYQFIKPSLSELIEACGGMFNALRHLTNGRWQAFDNNFVEPDEGFTAREGSTPEEAVARLYLALKKP